MTEIDELEQELIRLRTENAELRRREALTCQAAKVTNEANIELVTQRQEDLRKLAQQLHTLETMQKEIDYLLYKNKNLKEDIATLMASGARDSDEQDQAREHEIIH